MQCKHLTKRTKKYKPYFYCRLKRQVIILNDCKNCSDFILKRNKPIKKRTAKQNKLERERDKNLIKSGRCEYCGKICGKLDPHEVYGGSNRKRSIKYGFVKLLCRECHSNENIILELRKITQKEYEKVFTREDFIRIIGKSYL